MQVTYLGHSTFLVETMGKKILFDPFITPNGLAKNIKIEDLKVDFVLISHGHMDHVADAEAIARQSDATVIANYEIYEWFGKKDIKGYPLNHGGKASFDFGTVKCVNAIHSSVLPDGTYGGNPVGFVIWNEEGCFYFAGDTALTMDMKLIPMLCPKLDFAILPVGDNFTMGIEEAVIAADFIECDRIIGCHFDTFGFIKIDHQAAKDAFSAKNKELVLLEIEETQDFS